MRRIVEESGQYVDNGFREIYVNERVRDGSDVSELMEVFTENDVYNEKFPKTSEIKGRFKKDEKEKKLMCAALDEYVQELRKEDQARLEQYAAREQQYTEREQQYTNKIAELKAKLAKLQG